MRLFYILLIALLLGSCVEQEPVAETTTKWTISTLYENGDEDTFTVTKTHTNKAWFELSDKGCLMYCTNSPFKRTNVACDVRRYSVIGKEIIDEDDF